MFLDVEARIRRKNQILFSRESACLQALRELICDQSHLTIALWALDCVRVPLEELARRHPEETDLPLARELALDWAHGIVKMPVAKRAILNAHAAAKRMPDARDAALCHAVGQGCSAVHVETHALGLVFYELTAIVIGCGYADYEAAVLGKVEWYAERLRWWRENAPACAEKEHWADFLIRPGKVNREKRLDEKRRER